MPKLIDADKLLEWCNERLIMAFPPDLSQYADGRKTILELLSGEVESGTFDPTPPVQPDIKPGSKVRHPDHPEDIGEVWDHPQVKARFKGQPPRYYRLDKLEVIQPDTGEVITDEQR